MSRLDDELKNMFQRQEPSADFAQRVLAQINVEAQPKRSFWQALVSFFQLPTMRWAVAATAILLLAIIGVVQYQRTIEQQKAGVETPPTTEGVAVAGETPTPRPEEVIKKSSESETTTSGRHQDGIKIINHRKFNQYRHQRSKYIKETSVKNVEAIATQRKSAGELAKEQLMKALSIASATVNEAKKVAMGGD